MATQNRPRVIALEEHYLDREIAATFGPAEQRPAPIMERLYDYSEMRIAEMDEAGIDFQVLSHAAPATQRMDGPTAVRLAFAANNKLRGIVDAHPDRFAAFACLPTPDPAAAVDELERCVSELGFKGAMVHGLTNGEFKDGAIARILAREFWTDGKAPTFAEFAKAWLKANKKGLGVHLGLHPEAAWLTDRAEMKLVRIGRPNVNGKRRRSSRFLMRLKGTESLHGRF